MEAAGGLTTNFWTGKRVLITGSTGFKGAWLTMWLAARGAEVTGYANGVPTEPSLYDAARVGALAALRFGDVGDLRAVRDTIEESAPEVVFHLAAQALVLRSYSDPIATYRTNLLGTAAVLEALAASRGARVAVIATSDKCYRPREGLLPFRETDELGGNDPYSASKACAELVARAFTRSSAPRVATVRAGNVIGGGDWAEDRLVPDAARAVRSGQPLLIRSPDAVRPWQHILDCLSGYLRLAECLWSDGDLAGPWNLGPEVGEARTVSWLADAMVARWGGGLSWRHEPQRDGLAENPMLLLDADKARERLGWRPRLTIETALDWTVRWYRDVDAAAGARQTTVSQIERFESL